MKRVFYTAPQQLLFSNQTSRMNQINEMSEINQISRFQGSKTIEHFEQRPPGQYERM
jgi:hypothetical protein